MSIALQVVTLSRPLTATELEARMEQLWQQSDAAWILQLHEALLHGQRARMLGTCSVHQAPDPRDDQKLSPQELAFSTLITPRRPHFCHLKRTGLYFIPNVLYHRVFVWSFQRSFLTPRPDRYASQAFVRRIARHLQTA